MSLSQSDRLARYEVLGLIGSEGMGEVQRARDTELLEGNNLRSAIPSLGLPWRRVTEIGVTVADGLGATHGKGIVHRAAHGPGMVLAVDDPSGEAALRAWRVPFISGDSLTV